MAVISISCSCKVCFSPCCCFFIVAIIPFTVEVLDSRKLSRALDTGFARHSLSALVKRDNVEFDEDISKAEKNDYLVAVGCGALTGALSVLWSEKFSLADAHKWGNKKADDIVLAIAKAKGYKKKDLAGAIRFLEKK